MKIKNDMEDINPDRPLTLKEASFMVSMAVTENTKNIGIVLSKMIPNFSFSKFSELLAEETMKGVSTEIIDAIQGSVYGKKN